MKKPKITKGEWVFDGINDVFSLDNDDSICKLEEYISKYFYTQEANGRAISAVPEMIDALLEMYHLIQSLKNTHEWGVNVHHIDEENVINALKKAGCTFE